MLNKNKNALFFDNKENKPLLKNSDMLVIDILDSPAPSNASEEQLIEMEKNNFAPELFLQIIFLVVEQLKLESVIKLAQVNRSVNQAVKESYLWLADVRSIEDPDQPDQSSNSTRQYLCLRYDNILQRVNQYCNENSAALRHLQQLNALCLPTSWFNTFISSDSGWGKCFATSLMVLDIAALASAVTAKLLADEQYKEVEALRGSMHMLQDLIRDYLLQLPKHRDDDILLSELNEAQQNLSEVSHHYSGLLSYYNGLQSTAIVLSVTTVGLFSANIARYFVGKKIKDNAAKKTALEEHLATKLPGPTELDEKIKAVVWTKKCSP